MGIDLAAKNDCPLQTGATATTAYNYTQLPGTPKNERALYNAAKPARMVGRWKERCA
jgi:hypothetical protein